MLLDYLADHEQALGSSIDEYRHQAPAHILKTWHGSVKDLAFPATLEELQAHLGDADTTSVLNSALQLHDLLIDLYRYMAETAQTDSTRELFDNLLALEQHEKLRLVRDATRLEDY